MSAIELNTEEHYLDTVQSIAPDRRDNRDKLGIIILIYKRKNKSVITHQGTVVQSIVSLTSSLRGQQFKCFTLNQIHRYFSVEKMREVKSFSHIFNKKYWHISYINI